jgi:precorrin-3B methylase
MITECRIDHERRRVLVATDARLELSDLRWLLDHKARLGVWSYDTVSDERANRRAFSADEVRDIARLAATVSRRHGRGGRVAIVVTGEANYGMARMYSLLAEEHHLDCDVFRSVESAHAWLDAAPM